MVVFHVSTFTLHFYRTDKFDLGISSSQESPDNLRAV